MRFDGFEISFFRVKGRHDCTRANKQTIGFEQFQQRAVNFCLLLSRLRNLAKRQRESLFHIPDNFRFKLIAMSFVFTMQRLRE